MSIYNSPTSYMPPSMGERKAQIKLAEMFKMAFVEYFEYIGIQIDGLDVKAVEYGNTRSYASLNGGYEPTLTAKILGKCDSEQFKHLKKLIFNYTEERYPRLNRDSLYGSSFTDEVSLKDFSLFEYDVFYHFEMEFNFNSEKNINEIFYEIKKKTEPLLRKKYEETFDKQVLEELADDNNRKI